jgi:DNA polymerase III epsilon subunit-like protein/8-oxo-dGTP pyrophosphatase MutT (NUDIX family)
MTNWGTRLGVFDLETTGVDVDSSRIVSACVAVLDELGGVVARWDWLADPGIEIPAGASAVHGITTERARAEGRTARTVVAEIAQTLRVLFATGVPVVVYNAPYDLSLLDRECRRHGLEPLEAPGPIIDPLVIDKSVDRYRKGKRTLEVTAALYSVALDDAHDAGSDAIAAGRVALALLRTFPDELDIPLVDLHGRQEIWYAEHAGRFQDYIRSVKGDETYVADTAWPIRTPNHPTLYVDTQPIPGVPPRPGGNKRVLELEAPVRFIEDVLLVEGVETVMPVRPAPTKTSVLRVAAGIINDTEGRTLLVRKRGTTAFMQAGGKIEPGESALAALTRELREEVGLELDPGLTEYLGSFRAPAASEPGTVVRAEVFALTVSGVLHPAGEIEELMWIEQAEPAGIELAPLTRDTVLPLWASRRATLF